MLSKKLLWVAVLLMPVFAACDSKDENNDDPVAPPRPEIPLNAPADLIGSWKLCTANADAGASGAIYTFDADGSLAFTSIAFEAKDCSDEGRVLVVLKGGYVAGSGNALDLSMETKAGEAYSTLYRVFAVQNDQLLISNNVGYGFDPDHRDYYLDSNSLKMVKVAAN